jgi:ribosome-associated protein
VTASARSIELAQAAASAAADKQASDLTILDVSSQLVITDCFVLASAPNDRQVKAVEERTYYALERLWKDCPTVPLPADALPPPAARGGSG